MQVLIINQSEVQQLLPMAECLDVMAETLAALGRGRQQILFVIHCGYLKRSAY